MADWQLLDSVLRENLPPNPGPLPPPIPASALKRRSNQGTNWGVIVAFSLFAVLMVAGAILGVKFKTTLLPIFNPTLNRAVRQNSETAMDAASKPVTWTAKTLTEADVQKRQREFGIRQWLEGYEQRGDRSEACDADAVEFLKTWIARNDEKQQDTNSLTTAQWSDKLANDPACTDPLILTIAGDNSVELHEKARRLQRALDGFENSRHLAYPRFYAMAGLASTLRQLSSQDMRIRSVEASALNQLRKAFADGSILPGDQAEIADILVNGWGRNFFYEYRTAVCDLVRDSGSSYKWLSLVLDGEYELDEAWKARGGGYVNTVTPQGWQGFNTHLEAARESLTKAWNLRPDLALAPERMIYVSLGQSGIEDMRLWFDRTVAAQIDDPRAWSDLRWGLRPRWYGDLDSMRALGITALNTRRFDTDVPHKFIDVVSDMESEMELAPGTHIYGRGDIWPELQQMYEGYLAEPSQASRRYGWQSSYAVVAYLAGKYDVSRKQLEAMYWQPWRYDLTGWDADLSLMTGEVAARTGSLSEKVADAENARDGKLYGLALHLYTDLAAATNTDARTREFVRCRCAGLRLEQQLEKGGWVDFLPQSDDDPNWVYAWDEMHRITNGALEIKSGPGGHLCYSRIRVGTDFEVQGEFEVMASSSASYQAGLVMGMPDCDPSFNSYNWYAFRMKNTADEGQVACFAQGWSKREVVKQVAVNNGRNTFHFRLHGGQCSASVNDVEVFDRVNVPAEIRVPEGQFLLGLGAFNNNNDTVIRYRNVQVWMVP
jgi:hypothetical protein